MRNFVHLVTVFALTCGPFACASEEVDERSDDKADDFGQATLDERILAIPFVHDYEVSVVSLRGGVIDEVNRYYFDFVLRSKHRTEQDYDVYTKTYSEKLYDAYSLGTLGNLKVPEGEFIEGDALKALGETTFSIPKPEHHGGCDR